MSDTTTYDPRAASAAAKTAAEMRLGHVQATLEEEYDEAVAMADEYAHHLATGGKPWEYERTDSGKLNHGLGRAAREAVFDCWNDSRERKSLTYPWGGLGNAAFTWQVHEYLLDHLGEPVLYADLANVVNTRLKASPKDVATAVWQLQVRSMGAVRVRKVKVGGKSGYLAREPRPGDDELVDDAFLARSYQRGEPTKPGVYSQHVPFDFPTEEV